MITHNIRKSVENNTKISTSLLSIPTSIISFNYKHFTLLFSLPSLFSISVQLFLCNIGRLDIGPEKHKQETNALLLYMNIHNFILLIIQ